jgi:hypothetical protein
VLASTLTTSYSETTTCTLPSFIPASNYTVSCPEFCWDAVGPLLKCGLSSPKYVQGD